MIPESHTRHLRMVNPGKPKTSVELIALVNEKPLTVFILNDESEEQGKEEIGRIGIVIGIILITISDFWNSLRGR